MDDDTKQPSIICLMGPTGSGKSDLAIHLATRHACEIISVDSAMVYRGMDIGTAKPEPSVLQAIPHHLVDVCDPLDAFSAGQFREKALALIHQIIERGRTPLLVGGTFLYFQALHHGLAAMPKADESMRLTIASKAAEFGWPALHAELMQVDQAAAHRIHPNDAQRIQRALEVYYLTGKPITEWQAEATFPLSEFNMHYIVLAPPLRSRLHERIAVRFDAMLAKGFVDEVAALKERGDLHLGLPSMRSVGYRQVWEYLSGHFTFDEMHGAAVAATRQLAKRQMTWLRRYATAAWFDSEDVALFQHVAATIESWIT